MKHTRYSDMITSFQKIFGCFGVRRCAAALALATAAVMGCSKEDTPADSRVGETVLVRLPGVSVAAPVEVVPGAWGASAAAAGTRGIVPQDVAPCAAAPDAAPDGGLASADNAGELFSVTLGALPAADAATERGTAGTAEVAGTAGTSAPATRADAELSNVWVFQFDAAGSAVRCEYVGGLGVGKLLEVHLNSGEEFTIGVVAGGPASGLSTETVPDLTTFREGLLFASPVTSFEEAPYAGTLDGVRVLANGQVQVGGLGENVPVITLRRCMAQVTVDLTYNVTDYALDGVELYSVPVGAAFAPDRTAAVFPAAADANFGYRDNAAAGLAPHVQSTTGGTGRSYTWYIGQNRRGSGTGIAKVQDKNASKAPAYATYARVKTHSTMVADAPLYYDIYLGEDMFSDFNVTANHVYSYATRIIGSAAAHYSLIDTDGRVSGKKPINAGGNTELGPDSGQKVTWQNAIDYCSDKGAGWRLPTQNELFYYWCVEPAIPAGSKFLSDYYWSATVSSSGLVWGVNFVLGGTNTYAKTASNFVRCVRDEVLSEKRYPYVTTASDGGVIVVLRDENGGIDEASLFSGWVTETKTGNEASADNRMARKFRVQKSSPGQKTWSAAVSYCDNLLEEGYSDWRLPSQRELMLIWLLGGNSNVSLGDKNDTGVGSTSSAVSTPYIYQQSGFTAFSANYNWSATSWVGDRLSFWRMNFSNGSMNHNGTMEITSYVRCIRDEDGSAPSDVSEASVTPAGDIRQGAVPTP